ncbi:hypothetical protein AOLI_G00278690 [Acnodon oligacanthus]
MMRRARISVKPNFRPGGRSLPAGQQPSQTPADGNNTTPTVAAEEAVRPSPSPQRNPPKEELAEAVGVENAPDSPSEKTSADVHNGPRSSSTTTPASVPQRRMRVSATPQLVGPKASSTPQQSTKKPRSVPSALPKEKASGSVNSASLPESSILSSKAPAEVARQSSASHTPSSPCVPSTSGLSNPPIHEKNSMEHSPPSPQPGQVPQQPSHKLEPHKCPTSESEMPSSYVKLSHFDEPGSQQKEAEMFSDKEKILRALKLKALMKMERRKDIKNGKREVGQKPEYTPIDRSKMTMRDLIYYLPNTSPMRGSTVSEENGEEAVVPPSPRLPVKAPEMEEEEEEEEEECEDQDLLVPKVRVAEDGSIVLDEESLTVRVQRDSNTKVVEGSTALFERGSTTTYTSFRNLHYVRSWSVRETDMFYLAISMVGTDFSLIGQLLRHRSRAEIKNKFKKEEKTNGWRIDKAFRNKRPYDREFFSFLLEKVLAKDKEKGKSIKLVMTNPRKRGKARGKKGKQNEEECLSGSGADEDFDMEDGSYMDTEKENEGLPNVNKADNSVSAKKRKGTNDITEDKNNENSSEEQGKEKKKNKRARKTKKDMLSPEADAEGESGLFNADGDSVNADKDDELDSSLSAPKKKRKRSKKAEEERQDETSAERSKGKRSQKSLKASNNTDDSIGLNEENGIVDEDDSAAATKKRKRSQKSDLKEGQPAKEKKSTKRKKLQNGTVDNEGAEDVEASVTAEADKASTIPEDAEASVTAEVGESSKAKKINTLIPAEVMDKPPQRSARQVKKPRPNLATGRRKEASVPETTDGDKIHESQNENNSKFILEEEVSSLKTDKLQQQVVVVLERTPPRVQNLSEVQQRNNELEASMNLSSSPAAGESSSGQQIRMQRAERVKRSLTAERKKGKRKAVLDQDEAEHDPSTSAEDIQSSTDLLEQMVTQECEDPEAENTLNENLIDFSCLHHLDSHMFQRRPMVLLSREEVDKILNVQDQTTEDDPSVSPLDLSLNTELSFQLQCSNLMEENAEAAQVESVAEDYGGEILPQEMALSSVTLEEKQCEDMGLTELELDQSHISTPAKLEVNKQLEPVIVAASSFLENAEPEVDSKTVKDVVEESRISLLITPEIKEDSQGPILASSGVLVRSQDSVEIKARSQGSEKVTPEIKEGSQDLMLETLEVKKGSQRSILTALEIKERPGGSKVPTLVFKDDSQKEDLLESPMKPSEILEKSNMSVVKTPEIKEGSQGLMLETLEVKKASQGSALATLEIKEGSQDSIVAREIQNGSQVSILTALEMKERPEVSKVTAPLFKDDSQEDDLLDSPMEPSKILDKSKKSVVVISQIIEGSQGSFVATPEPKERPEVSKVPAPVFKADCQKQDLLKSPVEPSEILDKSRNSVVVTPEIKERSQGSFVATPETKERPEGSVVAAPAVKEYSQEVVEQAVIPSSTKPSSDASVSSALDSALKRRSRFPKPKPNLSASSRFMHSSLKQKNTEPRKISSEKILPQSCGKDHHCNLEDLSNEKFSKEEGTSWSHAMGMESESPKGYPTSVPTPMIEGPVDYSINKTFVLSDASPIVQETIATVTLNASSAAKLQLASEQTNDTCDMDALPHCASMAEDLHMGDTTCTLPLRTQTAEQENAGEMMGNFEELCAPAKIIEPTGDGYSEEEPTFILTLYEIPVTELYPASASTDQPPLPSTAESSSNSMSVEIGGVQNECLDILQNELSGTLGPEEESDKTLLVLEEKTSPGPCRELDQQTLPQATSQETLTPQAADEASEVSTKLETEAMLDAADTESKSEYKEGPELIPPEDLKPMRQSTPCTFRVSKHIAPVPQDMENTEQCKGVSHIVLTDVFVPVSEMGDDLIKHSAPIEEPTKDVYSAAVSSQLFTVTAESKDGPSLSEGKPQPKLVQRTSGKKDSSNIDQPTSSQAVLSASLPTVIPEIKQDSNTVSAKLEMEAISDSPKLQSSYTKGSSVLDPLQGKYLPQKFQITPCAVSLTRCVDLVTLESHRVPASEDDVPLAQTASEEKVADVPREKDPDTTDRTQEIKALIRRRKLQVKPKLQVRPSLKKETKCNLKATPTELVHTISAVLQEPELEKEASKLVMGDTAIKHDMESSSEDKESSLSMAHEAANLQSHDCMHFSVEATASCFGSSPADSENAEEDCEGASHMVLADIFVPVSEEIGDGLSQDWLIPIESSPHAEDVNLPKKQEVHPEEKPEESKESKTPIKRKEFISVSDDRFLLTPKDKQRTCATNDSSTAKLEEVDVSEPPKVPDLEAKESSDQVKMEEQLRRRHQIMPCTVRVSRCTDSLSVDLEEIKEETEGVLTDTVVPVSDKVGDNLSKKSMQVNKAASPSFTPSEESREQSNLEDIKSEEPSVKVQKKSPTRKKCKLMVKFPLLKETVKKTESSKSNPPNLEDGAVKLPLTISQTRQLTITAWAKKRSDQTGAKSETDYLPKASQMESNLKAKENSPLPSAPHALKTLCSRPQPADPSEIDKMSEDISYITLVPAEDAGEGSISSTKIHELETLADISPKNLKESNEEPSGSQINKSPARQRVNPQMKPAPLKESPTKDEDNSKKTDESLSTQLTSPTRQCTSSARAKEESEKASKKQTDDMSNAPRMETNSEGTERFLLTSDPPSPKHSALWPKVILPRVKLWTTDVGSSSDSSTPTSSPVRVSTYASQPVTPKLKKSPAVTPEQSPPMSSEDTEDEPSKVSQFLLCDIFTEVEDED